MYTQTCTINIQIHLEKQIFLGMHKKQSNVFKLLFQGDSRYFSGQIPTWSLTCSVLLSWTEKSVPGLNLHCFTNHMVPMHVLLRVTSQAQCVYSRESIWELLKQL